MGGLLFVTDYTDKKRMMIPLGDKFEIVALQMVNPDNGYNNYTRFTYSEDGTMNMRSICVIESPEVVRAQINTIQMMLEPSK